MKGYEEYIVDYFAKNGEIPNLRLQNLEDVDYTRLRKCIKEFWNCSNLNEDIEVVADEKLHIIREAIEKRIMKEEMMKTASEIIARRLCLYQDKVYKWMKKYNINFGEVVNTPIDDTIDAYMNDKPLKGDDK